MNNDCLGLYQVIDLDVIFLGDGQRHSLRDFRRDNPTERPDAGNSHDGTRQNIREHGTATHRIHEFSPLSECCFRALQSPGSLQRNKLSSTFCVEVRQTCVHLNSNRLVDQSGYSSGPARVFSYQLARKTSTLYGWFPFGILIAVPVRTQSCKLISDDIGTERADSLSSPSPQSLISACWQGRQSPAFASGRSYVHSWPFFSARQLRKRGRLFESAG
jgi:hypothetical protein